MITMQKQILSIKVISIKLKSDILKRVRLGQSLFQLLRVDEEKKVGYNCKTILFIFY